MTTHPVFPVDELDDPVVWGDDLVDVGPIHITGHPQKVARRLAAIAGQLLAELEEETS